MVFELAYPRTVMWGDAGSNKCPDRRVLTTVRPVQGPSS
jgi:hypothetical protein